MKMLLNGLHHQSFDPACLAQEDPGRWVLPQESQPLRRLMYIGLHEAFNYMCTRRLKQAHRKERPLYLLLWDLQECARQGPCPGPTNL